MTSKLISALIFTSLILVSACSPSSKLQRNEKNEIKYLLKKKMLHKRDADYSMERLAIRISGAIKIEGTGKLYIKNNEFIFATVQFMGMEVARALVTKDSLFYINRLESKYLFMSIKELQKKYTKRFNYGLIQNVVVKGIVLPGRINAKHLVRFIERNDNGYVFSLQNANQKLTMNYDPEMNLKYFEGIDPVSGSFLNADINYISNEISDINLSGSIGNKKVLANIKPGIIGSSAISLPEMKINQRYNEIQF